MSQFVPVEMFAMRRGHRLVNFWAHAASVAADGTEPVVRVRITPDEAGSHWAWWDANLSTLMFVDIHREGVETHLPNGSNVEEQRGHGKVVRVRVDVLREATAEEMK